MERPKSQEALKAVAAVHQNGAPQESRGGLKKMLFANADERKQTRANTDVRLPERGPKHANASTC